MTANVQDRQRDTPMESMDGVFYMATSFLTFCWLIWRLIRKRYRKHISALLIQAPAEARAASHQAFCTKELFTLEWANTLLGATWRTGLEPKLSAKLATTLEAALMKIIQGQAPKGPLRYLERIKVDTVRLGKQQPALSSCTASTEAATGCVRLALPFSFEPGEGFSVVLALYVRPAKLLPAFATRVAVTSLSMRGELLLSLYTSPEQAPGISTIGVSFAQPPSLDFNFHSFALAFGDLPFLLDMLKELAQKALTAKMVEPQKLSIDLSQRWMRGSASPVRELAVPAHEPNVAAQPEVPLHSPASAAGDQSEVGQSLRPLWPFGRKSSGPTTTAGMASLAVSVSAASTGPGAVAQATTAALLPGNPKVHVTAFAIDALAVAEQLQPTRESEEAKEGSRAADGPTPAASTDGMNMDSRSMYISARSTREGSDNDSMSARHHESDVPAAWGSLHENAVYSEERRMTHSTRGSCASLADELPDDFQVVDTASRLFGLPTDKGAVAGELAGGLETHQSSESQHSVSDQEGLAEVASLKANLAAIQKRMAAEQLRALVEGAPFMVHTAAGARLQHLWLQKQTGTLLCGPGRRSEHYPSQEDTQRVDALLTLCAADILDIKAGCAAFPKAPSTRRNSWVAIKGLLAQPRRASSSMISGQSAKVTLHVADDSRCFSILTESQSLHVEMPKGGNGRSRREWMDAIASLDACGTSAIALSVYG